MLKSVYVFLFFPGWEILKINHPLSVGELLRFNLAEIKVLEVCKARFLAAPHIPFQFLLAVLFCSKWQGESSFLRKTGVWILFCSLAPNFWFGNLPLRILSIDHCLELQITSWVSFMFWFKKDPKRRNPIEVLHFLSLKHTVSCYFGIKQLSYASLSCLYHTVNSAQSLFFPKKFGETSLWYLCLVLVSTDKPFEFEDEVSLLTARTRHIHVQGWQVASIFIEINGVNWEKGAELCQISFLLLYFFPIF